MPSYDFAVDLGALITAAQKAGEAITDVKDHDIEDFVPGEDDLGSDTVWSAVEEFKNRWERGVNEMVGDVEEVAGRLGKVAMGYAEFDAEGASTLTSAAAFVTGVVQRAVPGGVGG